MAEAFPDNPIQPCTEEPSENFKQFPYFEAIKEQMQFRTRQARRSDKEATVFLYGKSGAGKSTTINYLFHTDIVGTSEFSSGTQVVTEYACSVKNSGVFQSDLTMSFIDTPGFGETHGKEAENLRKISHFIGSKFSPLETFPSIVLIAVSAEDNRISGIHSMFSKMLHVLSKLNVVDRLHPNVVIVVTHAMYFLKKEYHEKSKQIEKICKVLARAHFCIEVPVVFIENLDRREEMKEEGDWKILPDGTRQPLNLFEAMIHLMKQSGDEIGVEAVRLLFKGESSSYEINEVRNTPQDSPETNISKWRQRIDEIFFNPTENEIYSTLSKHIGLEDIQIFPLVYNLHKIHLNKSIHLRNLNLNTIQQRINPFQLTDEENDWLVQLFEVLRINLKLNFSLLGLGYSRQSKEKRNRILLEIGPSKNVISGNYSLKIPEFCSVTDLRKIAIDIKYVKKSKWVLLRYLKITFRISYVLFQVDIDNDKLEQFHFNGEFIQSLRSLPEAIDLNSLESKIENPSFIKFVKDYALNCTTGLYFGGFVKGKIYFNPKRDEETSNRFLAEKSADLLTELESYFRLIQNGIRPKNASKIHEIISSDYEGCDLIWAGGNKRYHSETFLNLTVGRWNNWTSSIGENIICLDKLMNSTPLCTILSSSPDEKIRSYAQFIATAAEKETGLADQKFEGNLIISQCLGEELEISIQKEYNILTRIEASNRVDRCVLL